MKNFVLLMLVLALAGMCGAGVISVNLAEGSKDAPRANQTVLPEEIAGVAGYEVANWNNVQIDATGMSLVDVAGDGTSAVINFAISNGWGDSTADGSVAGANDKIARGYFDDGETSPGIGIDIQVTDVPYQMYDLVLYLSSDMFWSWTEERGWFINPDGAGTYGDFTVNGTTVSHGTNTRPFSTAGWELGENVIIFDGLSGPILDIEAAVRDGSIRSSIAGFQIVEVPEPATLILLGMGGMSLLRRKKA